MKTAGEILKQSDVPLPASSITFNKLTVAMEAYADQFKSKWIKVGDEEPIIGVKYLLMLKDDEMEFDKCVSDGQHSSYWNHYSMSRVTHFCLPKRPKK